MGDDFDNYGLLEAGSDVFGVSPSFNFAGSNSMDASMVGGLNYSLGIASGESEDTAGYNAATAANQTATTGIAGLFGNSTSGTSSLLGGSSAGSSTSSPGSAVAKTVSSVFTASTMTRVVAVIVGAILVIGALYLFGSSAISDAIGNAVSKAKGAVS